VFEPNHSDEGDDAKFRTDGQGSFVKDLTMEMRTIMPVSMIMATTSYPLTSLFKNTAQGLACSVPKSMEGSALVFCTGLCYLIIIMRQVVCIMVCTMEVHPSLPQVSHTMESPNVEYSIMEASCKQATAQFQSQVKTCITSPSTQLVVLLNEFLAMLAIICTSLSSLLIHEYLTMRVSLSSSFQEKQFNKSTARLAINYIGTLSLPKHESTVQEDGVTTKNSLSMAMQLPVTMECINEASYMIGSTTQFWVCSEKTCLGSSQVETQHSQLYPQHSL
jgi:hypothetical protein